MQPRGISDSVKTEREKDELKNQDKTKADNQNNHVLGSSKQIHNFSYPRGLKSYKS